MSSSVSPIQAIAEYLRMQLLAGKRRVQLPYIGVVDVRKGHEVPHDLSEGPGQTGKATPGNQDPRLTLTRD
jgi:hypothetical protein